jgi:hypothetical protein
MECRHFPDRDRGNNRLENLSWSTHKENAADRHVHGTVLRGEHHPNAKLSSDDIIDIRQILADGGTKVLAACWFGVSERTVRQIISRERWAWLPDITDYSLSARS